MAKKLLALLIAMCMIFSVCAVSVFAEGESTEGGEEPATEATDEATDGATEATDGATDGATEATDDAEEDNDDEEEEKTVNFSLSNAYLPNATVTVKGTVTGDVNVVRVEIICDEDDVEESELISVSKFKSTGVTYKLDDATVGAEYEVTIYDDDTDEELGSDSFLIKKGTSSGEDDGSNMVTVWIEGQTNRYIDETVVNLDWVKKPTVLEVAEYVLEEADRNYKSSKVKVTAIASTETGSTYTLKDNSTSKYYEDCEWAYILNGEMADYDGDWTDIDLKGGDEIVLFYGEPGTVGYPVVKVTPETISVKDEVVVSVVNRLFDEDGEIESEEPASKAKIYLLKRNYTSIGTAKTADSDGEYTFKSSTITTSWITSYQGGEIMAAGYQSSSKPLTMVSAKQPLGTDREGTVQAYVRIEGAHKTLLERTKSAKIDEFDLYNFMVEVLDDEDIDYETNDDETNFTFFESKSTTGYSNENGDIVRDSGWYVAVNDDIYTPDDDLEEVEIYPNDEILFYFGDKDTVPVVYYNIDGDLETEEKVYVYFYSDKDMTKPIEDLEVNFEGEDIDKDMETNSSGRVTLPTVEYKGTYTLSWGEQVGVRDDECPKAVMGEAELKFTGASKPAEKDDDDDDDDRVTSSDKWVEVESNEYECEYCGDTVTKVYEVEYDGEDLEVCKSCRAEINELKEAEEKKEENNQTGWEPGDTYIPQYGDDDFVPGPSKYYPDTNVDAWAVEGINKAYDYELMKGTAKGYFEPQRGITRAEFTTIICRIVGLDTDASSYSAKFSDVKKSDWHFGYIMAAYEAGYVNGMNDTTFAPNNYITREEIAVMVSRIINRQGAEADVYKFADGTSVSAWARVYVVGVSEAGIIKGDQFNQFLPKVTVNRQTAATIAARLYEYLH